MAHHARLVIIGAGIVGASCAYHLTKLGWKDVVIVDKGELPYNDGSTSHAPGGVVIASHSKLLARMAFYTSRLLRELPPFDDEFNQFNPVGGLEIARSQRRWEDLKRLHGACKSFGIETALVSPQEARTQMPLLNPAEFEGALFVKDNGIVKGCYAVGSLLREAEKTGAARVFPRTLVTDFDVTGGQVTAVLTANPEIPRIECEAVLLCTNIWSSALSDKVGVSTPLMAFEHQYVITAPIGALSRYDRSNKDHEVTFPTTRDVDKTTYFRQHWDSVGVGSYWHEPHMISPYALADDQTAIHPFTPQDFTEAWRLATELLPDLNGAKLVKQFNGIFAFSVDGYPIMGESSVKGFWVAVASWISHAGGVGKIMSELMTYGQTEWDIRQASIRRFLPHQTTQTYIDIITSKNYREVYDIVHPRQPLTEPRDIRLTPFSPRYAALDAVYTTFAGLELPNWFDGNAPLLKTYTEKIPQRRGWAAEFWSPIIGAEHLVMRNNVGLMDLTGLSIFEVKGPGATAFLNLLCTNQMEVLPGTVVYTAWLTPRGGIQRDLTVARLAADRYLIFVGEGTRPLDFAWMEQHAPKDGSIALSDISDGYTGLGLWGPNARKVLQQTTHDDVSNEMFPYFTAQWIDIGPVPVFAMRISYVGELGWELHIPMDSALPVWDRLWQAGQRFEMVAVGTGAMDSLRIEKGYRLWGGDIYTEYNLYEAGLGWLAKMDKGDFIGREATLSAKEKGIRKKLCCLTFEEPDAVAFGYEPIFGDNACIGHVTTSNFGYAVGRQIAYGYLPKEKSALGTKLEVEYFNRRFAATVQAEPLYDPRMTRLK